MENPAVAVKEEKKKKARIEAGLYRLAGATGLESNVNRLTCVAQVNV
jgi:hypothetical protein